MALTDDPRRRLLEAAGQVFAEKGFDGATVREICKRAGANIAAVNYYFRDKDRLYIEAVKSASCGSLETTPLPEWPSGTPAAAKLRDFVRVMAGRLLDRDKPAWHARLMMRELTQPTAACAEWVRDYVRPQAKVLGDILAELLPAGASELDRLLNGFSVMGQCLFYLHCRPVVQLLMGDDYARLTPDLIADHVTTFTLSALYRKAPRGKAGATPHA